MASLRTLDSQLGVRRPLPLCSSMNVSVRLSARLVSRSAGAPVVRAAPTLTRRRFLGGGCNGAATASRKPPAALKRPREGGPKGEEEE